jgi:peptide/nickel transport system ATP-binding protein
VVVKSHGELIDVGTVEQVLLHPKHDNTKSLLAAQPGGTSLRTVVDK